MSDNTINEELHESAPAISHQSQPAIIARRGTVPDLPPVPKSELQLEADELFADVPYGFGEGPVRRKRDIAYKVLRKGYNAAYWTGGKICSFLGITKSRYSSEIREHRHQERIRIDQEAERIRELLDAQASHSLNTTEESPSVSQV
ncbi:hypothetical protein PCE1_004358 [Barthelona sp. PCE]